MWKKQMKLNSDGGESGGSKCKKRLWWSLAEYGVRQSSCVGASFRKLAPVVKMFSLHKGIT
jgi:hypothetical protein